MNITGYLFRYMNRVTFFGSEFRRKGRSWLLDASLARPSSVYTIHYPEGPKHPEPLTERMMQVHCCGKRMLNKYIAALLLLLDMMEDIHRENMTRRIYRRLNRHVKVYSVFSRAFVRSQRQFQGLGSPCTVSEFVENIKSGAELAKSLSRSNLQKKF